MCPHHTAGPVVATGPSSRKGPFFLRPFRRSAKIVETHVVQAAKGSQRDFRDADCDSSGVSLARQSVPGEYTSCLRHVFAFLDRGDLRSARLVCKAWDSAARSTVKSLCPSSSSRPARINAARYPALESLDLTLVRGWGRSGHEVWIPAIQKLPLKHLVLGQTNALRANLLGTICSLPRLESLHLCRKQLPPGSHAALRNLPPSLRALTITWVHSDSPMSSSDNLAGLEYGASMHGLAEMVAAACELSQLKRLELVGCSGVPASSFAGLKDMHLLETLRLTRCGRLDAEAVTALSQAPSLHELVLSETELDTTTRMRSLAHVGSIDMGADACVTHLPEGAAILAYGLASNIALWRLGISARGTELDALALSAEHLHGLRELTLHAAPVSHAKALRALARLPLTCTTIDVTLVCDGDSMGETNTLLAEAIEGVVAATGTRLRSLSVLDNRSHAVSHPWLELSKTLVQQKSAFISSDTLRLLEPLKGTLKSLRLRSIYVPDTESLLRVAASLERLDLEDVKVADSFSCRQQQRGAGGIIPSSSSRRHNTISTPATLTTLRALRVVNGSATKLLAALRPLLPRCLALEQCILVSPCLEDADVRPLVGLPRLRTAVIVGTPPGRDLTITGTRLLLDGSRSLRRFVVDASWNRETALAAVLRRAPYALCQVSDCNLHLDEALDAWSFGRLEPFCQPGRLP